MINRISKDAKSYKEHYDKNSDLDQTMKYSCISYCKIKVTDNGLNQSNLES